MDIIPSSRVWVISVEGKLRLTGISEERYSTGSAIGCLWSETECLCSVFLSLGWFRSEFTYFEMEFNVTKSSLCTWYTQMKYWSRNREISFGECALQIKMTLWDATKGFQTTSPCPTGMLLYSQLVVCKFSGNSILLKTFAIGLLGQTVGLSFVDRSFTIVVSLEHRFSNITKMTVT